MSDKPKIEELKLHLDGLGSTGVSCLKDPCPFCEAIRAILTEHEKVKAALRDQEIADGYSVSALQAELAQVKAEREHDQSLIRDLTQDMNEYHDKAEKTEARLALAEPLLKAVREATPEIISSCRNKQWDEAKFWLKDILHTALSYCEALEAKSEGEK
jgi:hypothetical protein